MNVLVTGGAGYIGAHCCKELAARGFRPVVYDSLVTGHREHVQWGDFFEGDTGNAAQLEDCIAHHDINAVMHFAAFIEVGESVADPLKYYANNVANSLVLLRAAVSRGIRHVVFSSSAAVYGEPQRVPIEENQPTAPVNPYGWTKLMVETMLRDLERACGLRWAALRYFNAAGADAAAKIGEWHTPESHLIPRVLEAALNGTEPIQVYGKDYPTADGTCIRDYIHVTDLARAHVLALEYLLKGGSSGPFNLGQGQGFSVLEVVQQAAAVTGKRIAVHHTARRAGDAPVLIASNLKAKQLLGWKPENSRLDAIIDSAWRWHQRLRSATV
jgi:UDP-glucose 4-epimerase